MNSVVLVARQARYQNKAFWRNPAAAFFTFVFPLMFLVILNLLFGNQTLTLPGGDKISGPNFYVPGIAAMGIISACYTSIAIGVSFSRDQGLLKRVRGTPMPASAYLVGRLVHATFIAMLLVVIVVVAGKLFYHVAMPTHALPALIITVVVGAATFCSLGLAVTAIIPNADASPAVVNASILPLLFVSDVFIPIDNAPHWLGTFSNLFPVRHLSASLMKIFNPFVTDSAFSPAHLAVMAVWMVAGLLVASRFFSWEPRK